MSNAHVCGERESVEVARHGGGRAGGGCVLCVVSGGGWRAEVPFQRGKKRFCCAG